MNSIIRFAAAICLIALPATAMAQIDEIEIPRIGGIDGGVIHFNSASSNGRSVSVSVKDGVKTIKASEGDEKVVIVEDPDNGITVKLTQRFGPKDADKLEKSMPGLYMHLKSMPKKVDNAKVDVHVDVTREFEADDKDDLKNKHPEAFEAYEKYANARGGIRFGRGAPMRLEVMPRVVVPADIEKELERAREEMKKHMKDLKIRVPKIRGIDDDVEEKKEEKKEKKEERNDG